MVSFNEENNADQQFENGHVTAVVSDSDNDEDDNIYDGYEPLPLNDVEPDEDANDDEAVEENARSESDDLSPIDRAETSIVRDVWAGPSATNIEMDSEQIDEVKRVMSNITLPSTSIPDWANNIPEDEWKEHLFVRLNEMKQV